MTDTPIVLVTRTPPAGTVLADRIRERGLEARECAPFRLEAPSRPAQIAEALQTVLPADRVVITSQEGVRQSVELVGSAAFRRALVIVPGEGTAALARELGIENVVFPSRRGTSEAVLAMPELSDVEGIDVVMLAAEGGRSLMGEVLTRRGANVERIHVYRRVEQPLPQGLENDIMGTPGLVTMAASWEALSGLGKSLSPDAFSRVQAQPVVAPSRRVAERAAEIGFTHCITATGADDDAMLAALERVT